MAKLMYKGKQVTEAGCYHVLLNTGDDYLLEFNREAARKDANPHWCGFMPRDDVLCGENAMGKYMMEVRAALRKKAAPKDAAAISM